MSKAVGQEAVEIGMCDSYDSCRCMSNPLRTWTQDNINQLQGQGKALENQVWSVQSTTAAHMAFLRCLKGSGTR